MTRMTQQEIESAAIAARTAVEADRRHDVVARNAALMDLFGAAGYWPVPRNPTTAEFRGERVPAKMLRMPNGARALKWDRRMEAAQAWASYGDAISHVAVVTQSGRLIGKL